MKGYEIVGYWNTQNMTYCFMCGKQAFWFRYTVYPACDWYNAGGFCNLEFGACIFEAFPLCDDCAEEPVIYVGDMCLDIGGPMERDTDVYGEDDYYWEDPMDDAYYPAV